MSLAFRVKHCKPPTAPFFAAATTPRVITHVLLMSLRMSSLMSNPMWKVTKCCTHNTKTAGSVVVVVFRERRKGRWGKTSHREDFFFSFKKFPKQTRLADWVEPLHRCCWMKGYTDVADNGCTVKACRWFGSFTDMYSGSRATCACYRPAPSSPKQFHHASHKLFGDVYLAPHPTFSLSLAGSLIRAGHHRP